MKFRQVLAQITCQNNLSICLNAHIAIITTTIFKNVPQETFQISLKQEKTMTLFLHLDYTLTLTMRSS